MTVGELAEETGKSPETIRRNLNRMAKQGRLVKLPPQEGEKEAKWGLKQRG